MMGYCAADPPKDKRQRTYWLEHDCEVVQLGEHQPDDGCGICCWHRFGMTVPGSVITTMRQGRKPMGPPPRYGPDEIPIGETEVAWH